MQSLYCYYIQGEKWSLPKWKNTTFSILRAHYKTCPSRSFTFSEPQSQQAAWWSRALFAATIALIGSLHFPQNKTVTTVGHFLVQSLCPASEIRKGGLIKTDPTEHYVWHPQTGVRSPCGISVINSMSSCGGLSVTVFVGQLTLGLS